MPRFFFKYNLPSVHVNEVKDLERRRLDVRVERSRDWRLCDILKTWWGRLDTRLGEGHSEVVGLGQLVVVHFDEGGHRVVDGRQLHQRHFAVLSEIADKHVVSWSTVNVDNQIFHYQISYIKFLSIHIIYNIKIKILGQFQLQLT